MTSTNIETKGKELKESQRMNDNSINKEKKWIIKSINEQMEFCEDFSLLRTILLILLKQ